MTNWINDEVKLSFKLPTSLQPLVKKLEELEQAQNYAYFNYSDALDCAAKELVVKGRLSVQQWEELCAKYDGG